jgi:hypothetical protein
VTFLDGGSSIGSGTLSGGTTTFSTSSLSVGNHTITVSYSGDGNFNSSSSSAITQTVNKASSSTSVASSENPSMFGDNVTFTATVTAVSPGAGTPTGTVNFTIDGSPSGSGTLSGGTTSISTSSLSAGAHTVVATYAGDTNFTGGSGSLTQTVNQASSSTAVSSSVNPSVFGQSVTFSATVSSCAGTPTGTVQFFVDGSNFGSPMTLSGGTASTSTAGLSVGTHTITASYSGDTNFSGSSGSLAGGQTVNQASSSTSVSSSENPSIFGDNVTFTATVTAVSPGAGTPTGTVNFTIDGNPAGSGTLSGGTTSISTGSLSAGTHTVAATYAGDTNFTGSFGSLTQTVNQASSTTAVSSSANPSVFGQSVTFTATVSSSAGTPTGTVQFIVDGSNLGSPVTLSGGTASTSTAGLSVGTHTITASYSGDTNFSGSSGSLAGGQTVNQASSGTSVSSSENPSIFGDNVTFTATVTAVSPGAGTPTGTVNFTIDGSPAGSGTLSGGTTSISTSSLSAGTHTVVASYTGDTNFTGSSGSLTQTVNQASSSTAVSSSVNPSVFGQSVTFTATVSSSAGTPTGTVQFIVDGSNFGNPVALSGATASTTTGGLSVGTHTITASYSGDTNFSGSSGTLSGGQTVNQASSTTSVSSSLNPSTFGQSVTFTTTVAAVSPGAGSPGGTVQFVIDGSNFGSPVALSGGSASVTTSTLSGGVHTVSATYSGDANFTGSSGTLSGGQTVNAASTTTAFASSANPSLYGNSVTFTATVTSTAGVVNTGTVTFLDGANTLASVGVSSGKATFATGALTAGIHSITASYSDGSNFGSSSASLNQTVNQRPLFITANSTSKNEGDTLTFTGTEFTLAGPAGSRRPVLFNGDTITSASITSAGAAANAEDGSYLINISNAMGTGVSNYAITYVPGTLTVLETAINVTVSSPSAINEGDASASVEVATFTHASGVEAPGHFSATLNWGIAGHTADPGTITQDGSGTYHVSATRPVFTEEGSYALSVSVSDNDSGGMVSQHAPLVTSAGTNIDQNFAGLSANDDIATFGSFFIPPDQGSAVGPNHYVEMINLIERVYNKDGTPAAPVTDLGTFYANAGLPNKGTSLSDPRIVYDPASGRWFAVIITTDSNSNSVFIAVSQTSDPTGVWKGTSFVANTTANNFADYPTIAVDTNALYIASNNFLNLSTFDGVSLTSIPKADLLGASPTAANRTHFENITGGGTAGTTPFTFAPVSSFGARNHGVVYSVDGFSPANVLHYFTVSNPGSNSATLSADNPLAVPMYWNNQNAHEPDGSRTLNGGDFRTGQNNVYQVGNIVWIADSILTSSATGIGAYDAIRWYEIDESTNTLLQSGTISDPHNDFIYPAIAANAAGDVVIGFTETGDSTTSDYPGAWYVAGATTGGVTTFGAPTQLRNGSSNYNITGSGRNRWGDFGAISVDPNNPNAFWMASEVAVPGDPARTTRTQVWGTQISEIAFGNTASGSTTQVVNEPAINGASSTLPALVVGQPGSTVEVATFTHANGVEPTTDFTATVNWGVAGHTADPATITQDGGGTYHVSSLQPTFNTAGSYTVTVSISEDNGSTTVTDTQQVNAANTTTTIMSSANPQQYANAVTFTAQVTANAPSMATVNTGTVTFLDGANTLASVAVSAIGKATFTTSALTAGVHSITASYSDGSNFNSSSASLNQTINQRPLFITANSTSKNEGDTLTFAGTEFTLAGPAGSRRPVLFNGDTITSATITSAGAAANAEDGSDPINISNAMGTGVSNYAITYVPGTLTVLEPAITVTNTPISAVNEGDASASVEVATFTHAKGVEDPGHFSATIDWGVAGHHSDAGIIAQDNGGTYHVSAARPVFTEDGSFNVSVQVCDNDAGPNIGQNFMGLSANDDIAVFGGFFVPPDQGSAVGPAHYVEMINLVYAIYNKDGSVAVPATALSTFYQNAGLPNFGTNLSDPRIVYDPESGRWFSAIITTQSNSNSVLLAVSQTSDPTGAWKGAMFVGNTTPNNFADYPTIGIDANAMYIAYNNFANGATFDGVSLTTIPKSDLLNPAGPVVSNRTHFENITGGGTPGTTPFTFAPVSAFNGRDHGVMLATDGFTPASVLHRFNVTNPGSSASSLSADMPLSVPTYWNNQNAHEPDGTRTLNGGDFRLGQCDVFQVDDNIWVADSILTSSATGIGAYDAIRWYEISESTNTVLQSGTISDPHHDYIYPSIAANAMGCVVIGFTATGDSTTSDYPGSWYVAGKTVGGVTTFGAPIQLKNGSSNYNITAGGRNRWGDFSAISVDPTNPNAFWIAEETVVPGNPSFTTRTQVWGTQISEIVCNNCVSTTNTITVNEPAINGASASLPPVVVGQPGATVEVATFTHADGVEPTGDFTATVDWGIDGHHTDPGTVTQDGSGTYHISALRPVFSTPGLYTVAVSISEDNGSTTVTDTQEVDQANTSTSVTSSLNPSVFGNSVTFTATVTVTSSTTFTPTGTVQFIVDGSNFGSPQPLLSNGTATLTTNGLSAGVHTVMATYSGDANFNGSTGTLPGGQTVNQDGTSTSLSSSLNPSTHGQSVTFTATVTANPAGSGTPTGTVTFLDGATTLGTGGLSGGVATFTTALSGGFHTITASYGGDTNFTGSTSAALTQTVTQDNTTTTVVSSQNPSANGQSVTFTITVVAVAPGTGVPTGTVTLAFPKNIPNATIGTATLNGSGQATITTSSLPNNSTDTLAATYNGDSNFNTSSGTITQSVGIKTATTAILSSPGPNPSVFGTSVTFTCTVTGLGTPGPTGNVAFIDVKATIAVVPLSSGKASFSTSTLSIGTHRISATYLGSSFYNTSSTNVITQTVTASTSNTVIASSAPPARQAAPINPTPVSLIVSASPAQATDSQHQLVAAAAAPDQAVHAIDHLAMNGSFATHHSVAQALKKDSGSLDLTALDRFFSDF